MLQLSLSIAKHTHGHVSTTNNKNIKITKLIHDQVSVTKQLMSTQTTANQTHSQNIHSDLSSRSKPKFWT